MHYLRQAMVPQTPVTVCRVTFYWKKLKVTLESEEARMDKNLFGRKNAIYCDKRSEIWGIDLWQLIYRRDQYRVRPWSPFLPTPCHPLLLRGLCLVVLTILRSTALDSLQINLYRKSSMIIFIFILGVSLVTVRRMIVSGEARESCN